MSYDHEKFCCTYDYCSYIKDKTEYKLNDLYNSYINYITSVQEDEAKYRNKLRITLLKGYIYDEENFEYNDECEHEYDRKKDFNDKAFKLINSITDDDIQYIGIENLNNYKLSLLLKYILYYRENKEQEDLNKALKLFRLISPEHEGIDKEFYNIAICALATEFVQLDGVESLKTSLVNYITQYQQIQRVSKLKI